MESLTTSGVTVGTVVEVAAAVALFAGLAVTTLATVGVLRFRDAVDVVHAASMASATGVILVLLASVGTGDGTTVARATLVAVFVLVTSTVEGHAVVQAAIGAPDDGDAAPSGAGGHDPVE